MWPLRNKRYLFIGNRFQVLHKMLELKMPMAGIFAHGVFLKNELNERKIFYRPLGGLRNLINALEKIEFDVLVSNGCPYILPISSLQNGQRLFLNVHPSLLPDLRGKHPVNAAILFNRSAGATCHIMNDRVDAGPIVSRVPIGLGDDLNLGLLYQLCFLAEADAFEKAYQHSFRPLHQQPSSSPSTYYSRKDEDFFLDLERQDTDALIRRIRAFGISSQGAFFRFKNKRFIVLDAAKINNRYLSNKVDQYKELEIVFRYEDNIVIKKESAFIQLMRIKGNLNLLKKGIIL